MEGFFPTASIGVNQYFYFVANEETKELEVHYEDRFDYPQFYMSNDGELIYDDMGNFQKGTFEINDDGNLLYTPTENDTIHFLEKQSDDNSNEIYAEAVYQNLSTYFTIDENGCLWVHQKGSKIPPYYINGDGYLIYEINDGR